MFVQLLFCIFGVLFCSCAAIATTEIDSNNVCHRFDGAEDDSSIFPTKQDNIEEATTCVVCGSHSMVDVLDLHEQPLANHFTSNISGASNSERFPLRLRRCKHCRHTQLSHIVDRGHLFSHYLYKSGTSATLLNYFDWVANKVSSEVVMSMVTRRRSVIDIASNDGSQLDSFNKLGWITHGVDPAANLATDANSKGHVIHVGFWGVDKFDNLPEPDELDAIVAQNVLAHVSDPTQFMRACSRVMGAMTRLYIQTSQCEMFETGQFDTIYHEHISFFTAHSFDSLAKLAGLVIVNYEITEIHGRSCFVTFMKQNEELHSEGIDEASVEDTEIVASLETMLHKEKDMGMLTDHFYMKYQMRVEEVRRWMNSQLASLYADGYDLAGYGAAAKGIVLLHYLLETSNKSYEFSFVIDDAPMKQGTYCPGTTVPVKPVSVLGDRSKSTSKPLVIVVFAWNFWEEVATRIQRALSTTDISEIIALVPFPHQRKVLIPITPASEGASMTPVTLLTNKFEGEAS